MDGSVALCSRSPSAMRHTCCWPASGSRSPRPRWPPTQPGRCCHGPGSSTRRFLSELSRWEHHPCSSTVTAARAGILRRRGERALALRCGQQADITPTSTLLLADGAAADSFWLGGRKPWPPLARHPQRHHRDLADDARTRHPAPATSPPRPAKRRHRPSVRRPASLGPRRSGMHLRRRLARHAATDLPRHRDLIPVDDHLTHSTNLGRVVGATQADIDTTAKTTAGLPHRCGRGPVDHDNRDRREVPRRLPRSTRCAPPTSSSPASTHSRPGKPLRLSAAGT